jgi:hypothetical protein
MSGTSPVFPGCGRTASLNNVGDKRLSLLLRTTSLNNVGTSVFPWSGRTTIRCRRKGRNELFLCPQCPHRQHIVSNRRR